MSAGISNVGAAKINASDALDFYRVMFDNEPTEFRFIHGRTGKTGHYWGYPESDIDLAWLAEHNRRGFGIYAVINRLAATVEQRTLQHKGARDQDVTGVRAVFVDFDGGTQEENEAKLAGSPLAPSLTLCSGLPSNLHAYWLTADMPVEDFERVQVALAKHFGSDPKVKNPSHIMRLPGFINTKPKYKPDSPVARLLTSPGLVHPRAELLAAFGIPLDAPAAPQRTPVAMRPPADDRARKYALAALDGEAQDVRNATEGARNDQLNRSAFALGQLVGGGALDRATVENVLLDAATAAGLDDSEARATIRSGMTAGALEPRSEPSTTGKAGRHVAARDDDDEHSIAFEVLHARAQAATIEDVGAVLANLRYLADSNTPNSQREAVFQVLKEATGLTLKALRSDFAGLFADQGEPERETLSEQLLNLVLGKVELWHDADEEPHITIKLEHHQEHHRLNTRAVRRWLQREWYLANGGTISREPLTEVLGILEGKAIHDGEQHEVFLRVAEVGEGVSATIYLDMGDPACHAIEVTGGGWRIIDSNSVPVYFTRSAGMLPLPTPQPGDVSDIAAALGIPHLTDDGTPSRPFQGALAWLLQAFRVRGPFPVLPLFGQQGSGKTTFTKHLCGLLDPHTATLRVLSRDERDILISARHSWLQAKDNVSRLSQWTSDAFCRLATGGAISTRTLYTNDEETILNAKRPVLLNGITAFLEQQDLVDRSIAVTLLAIPEEQRVPESELEAKYERARPKALGALLDIVAAGLTRSGKRHLARLPRMADFAEWIVACSPALGWDPEDFLNWYANTKADLVREALDSSAITPALLSLIDDNSGTLELSASEMLAELNHATGISDGKRAPSGWPKRAQSLSNEIRRLQPALLQAEGIEVEQSRTNKARVWRLHKIGKLSSPSSPQPWLAQKRRPGRKNSGDDESEAGRHSSSLIVTASSLVTTGDDPVTRGDEPSSPQTARSHRHDDASDASDDQMPTLRGGDELQHRAAGLATRFAALPIETLRIKYEAAAERAPAPAGWRATAKTESLAVTVALELLAVDQNAGLNPPPTPYLNAARQAVAALPKPQPATATLSGPAA